MNTPLVEKSDKAAVPDDRVKFAHSLKAMLDALILNRTEALIERFYDDRYPFHQLYTSLWTNVVFSTLEWNGAAFRMDITCQANGYTFKFWDQNDKEGVYGRARSMIRQMNYFNADIWQGGVFRKEFEYPDEENDLYQYITTFKKMLAEAIAR